MASASDPPQPLEDGKAVQPAAPAPPADATTASLPPRRRSRRKQAVRLCACSLLAYLGVAYFFMPAFWRSYVRRHPSLDDIPGITHTGNGIPGDPLNVALIGTKPQVIKIMVAAGWFPADSLTWRSSLGIAAATILRRPYDEAPVSSLYLWGRKQDLAFEQPVGDDPRKRHHVRFWLSDKADPDDRPVWVGSATFDRRVGLSFTTGQITHHIAANVDAERDHLFRNLEQTGDLAEMYIDKNFHKVLEGHNGGGNPWQTDGSLYVGVIAPNLTP